MIHGIGTDIVDIARFVDADKARRLARRILTERERTYMPEPAWRLSAFVAGRFAAKEAIAKALGTGIGAQFAFRDVEIIPDEHGKPQIQLSAVLQDRFPQLVQMHLSISHTDQYATAMVVLEQA